MKLNSKRTVLVGFAFMLICMFWQAYDSIVPKILTDKFGMPQVWSGIVMALDNVLAVFLLPLFGALSDRKNSKIGKRTPFILIGTLAAAILFVGLSFADNLQLTHIGDISAVPLDEGTERISAMETLYDANVTVSADDGNENKVSKPISEFFTKEEFISISTDDERYNTYVVPARQAYAWKKTCENPVVLAVFMLILLGVLLSMATFRSPAVALMPDVTPKPLRSKANAIINLMGSIGGILILVLGIVFGTGKTENSLMSYTMFFMTVSILMLAALTVFMLTVKEPKWSAEARELSESIEKNQTDSEKSGIMEVKSSSISAAEKRSLFFILASVVLWYMGYNAVTSKYSVYAGSVLGMDFNTTLIIAQAAAILSYIPVGIISSKVGRRRTILAGVIMLGFSFACASLLRSGSNIIVMNALFALAGIGWATINVNSYPMVVELAKNGNIGKYTGFYYTASMAAQIITPIISGAFLTYVGMTTLFPYAALFVAAAFLTMLAVKHGDVKPLPKKALIDNLDVDGD